MNIGMLLFTLWACGDDQSETKRTEKEVVAVDNKTPSQTGEQLYQQYCASCHMINGTGMIGRAPPLAGSEWVTMDSSVPIRIVLHGLQGEIEVKGQKFNGIMASWGGILDDEEVSSILSYIRSSWGNSAAAVRAEEVSQIREQFKGHGLWKASELK